MSPADGTLSGRQPKAVQSALRVLEEVARAGVGVTAKEIAENLSMPSATAYRLLNLLVADGYIVRLPDLSGFSLGHRMGVLIDAAVAPTVCTAAREVLAELRLSVRFGVHLFYFTNTAVRAADLDTEFPPPVDEAVLNRNLHRSAVGRLLLAEKQDSTGWFRSARSCWRGSTTSGSRVSQRRRPSFARTLRASRCRCGRRPADWSQRWVCRVAPTRIYCWPSKYPR